MGPLSKHRLSHAMLLSFLNQFRATSLFTINYLLLRKFQDLSLWLRDIAHFGPEHKVGWRLPMPKFMVLSGFPEASSRQTCSLSSITGWASTGPTDVRILWLCNSFSRPCACNGAAVRWSNRMDGWGGSPSPLAFQNFITNKFHAPLTGTVPSIPYHGQRMRPSAPLAGCISSMLPDFRTSIRT